MNGEMLRYFIEFRKRLINCLFILVLAFGILFYFTDELYSLLASPLLRYLPHGQGLIATNIVAPLFVPLELTLYTALFATVPFILYQIWAFVAPALYRHERRLVWLLLFVSTGLFYVGIAFAYFVVFPLLFRFLVHTAPLGVMVMPDMSQYMDFTLKLFFIFGVIFEVPVVTILLIRSGLVSRDKLIQLRPYAIVGAFIIGMLLAPPDVMSQTLIAVPLWILFEAGIFFSRYL